MSPFLSHTTWHKLSLGQALRHCSLVTVRRKETLTLGLFILARGPPADAGLVFIQIEEPHQTLGTTAELHHLGPHLHGAHTFLHWKRSQTEE